MTDDDDDDDDEGSKAARRGRTTTTQATTTTTKEGRRDKEGGGEEGKAWSWSRVGAAGRKGRWRGRGKDDEGGAQSSARVPWNAWPPRPGPRPRHPTAKKSQGFAARVFGLSRPRERASSSSSRVQPRRRLAKAKRDEGRRRRPSGRRGAKGPWAKTTGDPLPPRTCPQRFKLDPAAARRCEGHLRRSPRPSLAL